MGPTPVKLCGIRFKYVLTKDKYPFVRHLLIMAVLALSFEGIVNFTPRATVPKTSPNVTPTSSATFSGGSFLRLLDLVWPSTTIRVFARPWPDYDFRPMTHHFRELITVRAAHHPKLAEGQLLLTSGTGSRVISHNEMNIV